MSLPYVTGEFLAICTDSAGLTLLEIPLFILAIKGNKNKSILDLQPAGQNEISSKQEHINFIFLH